MQPPATLDPTLIRTRMMFCFSLTWAPSVLSILASVFLMSREEEIDRLFVLIYPLFDFLSFFLFFGKVELPYLKYSI